MSKKEKEWGMTQSFISVFGEEGCKALTDPQNIGAVLVFLACHLRKAVRVKIGNREYEIVPCLSSLHDVGRIHKEKLIEMAKMANASSDKETCDYLLEYSSDIPEAFLGKCSFVFTEFRMSGHPEYFAEVNVLISDWSQDWNSFGKEIGTDIIKETQFFLRRVS